MDTEKLIERLNDYGADTVGALGRFINDGELYHSCLMLFRNDREYDALKEALSDKDYSAAFNAAHALKRVAGNLGLTPLYKALCALVEALRSGREGELEILHASVKDSRKQLEALLEETEN